MMLGRKRAERRQARVDTEVRAALTDFTTAMESRVNAEVERSRKTQLALIQSIQRLRDDIDRRDDLIAHALTTVTGALDRAADRMEAERDEQRALTEVVFHVASSLDGGAVARALPASERLLGGRVGDELARHGHGSPIVEGDEVLCLLEGRWVDGFEVVAVVKDADTIRYQLQRQSDGSVSHRLFDADEVRRAGDVPPTRDPARWFWSRA